MEFTFRFAVDFNSNLRQIRGESTANPTVYVQSTANRRSTAYLQLIRGESTANLKRIASMEFTFRFAVDFNFNLQLKSAANLRQICSCAI